MRHCRQLMLLGPGLCLQICFSRALAPLQALAHVLDYAELGTPIQFMDGLHQSSQHHLRDINRAPCRTRTWRST